MTTETTTLDSLVGEGKKYATVEDLAKSRVAADQFIDQLKSETAGLRTELDKLLAAGSKDEALTNLLNQLKNTMNKSTTLEPPKPSDAGNQPQALTQDDIVKVLEAREKAAQEERNLNEAMGKLKQVYGEKAEAELTNIAQKLGLTVESLHSIAKASPNAFINTIGLNQRDTSTRSMANGGRSGESVAGSTVETGVRDKAYWERKRAEMGSLAFLRNRDLNVQMHMDMQQLGSRWEGQ